jgi:hypothetical protein
LTGCLIRVGQITRRSAHPPPGLFRAYTPSRRASRNARKTSREGAPGRALGPVEYAYEKATCLAKLVPVCDRPARFRPPEKPELTAKASSIACVKPCPKNRKSPAPFCSPFWKGGCYAKTHSFHRSGYP